MVKHRFHTTFSEFLPSIISNIYNVIFFSIGAYLIVKNQFTTGLLVLGYQYINILSNPILDICSIIVRYKSNSENIQRVDDLHELALTPIDHSNQILNNGLLFEANQFSYHLYSNNQLLFNIHEYLSLDKSSLYLIKGANGVGKSMFINLLIGKEKIDNCEGQFNVTNDIQQYSYLTYPHLFIDGSINNNMFGISINQQVKDMLNIDFENKEITTNPLNLSLGQQQKLSLLRTLSKPALYYLLDEPMSNLDTLTQSNLVNYIKHLKKDKTVIVIVHDNSLDSIADKTISIHDQKMEVG